MTIQIKLDYNDKIYLSNKKECTKEHIEETKDLITQVAQGKMTYMSIESGCEEYFFTKEVLEKSIITVIVT
jgi:hypothetical protein